MHLHSIDKYLIASVCIYRISTYENFPLENKKKKKLRSRKGNTTTGTVIRWGSNSWIPSVIVAEFTKTKRGGKTEERERRNDPEIKVSGRRWIARNREERPKEGENSREVVCQYGSTTVPRFGFRRQQANEWNSSALKFQTSPGKGGDISADARRSKWRVVRPPRDDPEFLLVLPILLARRIATEEENRVSFASLVKVSYHCSHLRIFDLRYLDRLTQSVEIRDVSGCIPVLGYLCLYTENPRKCWEVSILTNFEFNFYTTHH